MRGLNTMQNDQLGDAAFRVWKRHVLRPSGSHQNFVKKSTIWT